ncbi:MAG: choice-of-anchor Q domain-containing protein [bacterium]|nr:choice-of-anchor Q domain-containing protein [bacterium]
MYLCDAAVQNNVIAGNSASEGGGLVEGNLIVGNSAVYSGGGLCYCDGTIRNNLIIGNSAGEGGGLYDSYPMLQNNVIAFNSATEGNGGGMSGFWAPYVSNCILWGNTAAGYFPQLDDSGVPTYCCIQDWTGGGEGNISSDPGFVDPDGPDEDLSTYADNDFRLLSGSPCIDAGKNQDWMAWGFDMAGNPRIAFGGASLTVDMGAYEFRGFVFEVVRVKKVAGGTEVLWASRPADSYVICSCADLVGSQWQEEARLSSQGGATAWTDPDNASRRKFYKIEIE